MTPRFGLSCVLWSIIVAHGHTTIIGTDKPTIAPLFRGRPFLVAWAAPTHSCSIRFNVSLDLRLFDLSASPSEELVDQNATIFYKERLGLYPYYDEHNVSVNGGVPQNASLRAHLLQMVDGINKYIPFTNKDGLAIIDWEDWRPTWLRNWDDKDIYRQASRQLVAFRHPNWTANDVNVEAKSEFENSAREFMVETLQQAKRSRPRQLWGYYLFPDCYNHDYQTNWDNYTGKCPDVEMSRNDQLWWMWEESTALYPSIYLTPSLNSSVNGRKFVHYRLKEAMRIALQHTGYSLPVLVYTRPTYKENLDLLSQMDLISTIGESAAQGAAGVIFWGDTDYAKNEETCQTMKTYVDQVLGRYIVNVTTAASLCSQALCGGNGRCLRKENVTDAFLHLNPANFRIVTALPGFNEPVPMWAQGQLSEGDVGALRSQFRCQCYLGESGNGCNISPEPVPTAAPPTGHGRVWLLMACLWILLQVGTSF
ncbi:PREDICTED: hyaluronidase-2-like [Nanorana parkeri]|uniref:hyaluronidase-2-like n=1 Tax=Nanorana parkeri TaxID=125878 RepID=UPI0008546D35|nr:PREDICTED: hyaluronidase-2-like [Nanorana parkeri]